ncbi:MAG TPA: hypothetical protein VHQ47_09465 [Phycisphaerae bacterium]|jgi:hypothetical protein|nr:hypothetical protein [Phycisphaerae bacterium]
MSRVNTPGTIRVRPTPNVYTAMAFVSMLAMLAALAYTVWKFHDVGLL